MGKVAVNAGLMCANVRAGQVWSAHTTGSVPFLGRKIGLDVFDVLIA